MKMHRNFLVMEVLVLAAAVFLEYYAHQRMGLVRHFTYTNYVYQQMTIAKIPTACMAVIPLFILSLSIKRLYYWVSTGRLNSEKLLICSWALVAVMQVGLLILFLTKWGQASLTYPFLWAGLLVLSVGNLAFHSYYRLKCGVC